MVKFFHFSCLSLKILMFNIFHSHDTFLPWTNVTIKYNWMVILAGIGGRGICMLKIMKGVKRYRWNAWKVQERFDEFEEAYFSATLAIKQYILSAIYSNYQMIGLLLPRVNLNTSVPNWTLNDLIIILYCRSTKSGASVDSNPILDTRCSCYWTTKAPLKKIIVI